MDNHHRSLNSRSKQKPKEQPLKASTQKVDFTQHKTDRTPMPPRQRSMFPEMTWHGDKHGMLQLKRTFLWSSRTPKLPPTGRDEQLRPQQVPPRHTAYCSEDTRKSLRMDELTATKVHPNKSQTQIKPHQPQSPCTDGCGETAMNTLRPAPTVNQKDEDVPYPYRPYLKIFILQKGGLR